MEKYLIFLLVVFVVGCQTPVHKNQTSMGILPKEYKEEILAVYRAVLANDLNDTDIKDVVVKLNPKYSMDGIFLFHEFLPEVKLKNVSGDILKQYKGRQIKYVGFSNKGGKYDHPELDKVEELAKTQKISPLTVENTIKWFESVKSKDEKELILKLLAASYDVQALRYLLELLHDCDPILRGDATQAIDDFYSLGLDERILREYSERILKGAIIELVLYKEIDLRETIEEAELGDIVSLGLIRNYININQDPKLDKTILKEVFKKKSLVFDTGQLLRKDGNLDWERVPGIYYYLSRVGFIKKLDAALVYVGGYHGSLCGASAIYILRKYNGKWKVFGSVNYTRS